MANWKHVLDISDIWDAGLEMDDLGRRIATRLTNEFESILDDELDNFDEELEEIIYRFNSITGYDDTTPEEEFDDVLNQLYDWADQEIEPFGLWPRNKMCWVKTSF